MKEYEVKRMLSKEEYIAFVERFSKDNIANRYIQINYYYDTDDLRLFNSFETLRIRQIDSKLNIEYKYNRKSEGSTKICDEYSKEVDTLPYCLLNPVQDTGYVYYNIGNLITERTDYLIDGYKVSIDKNYYIGTVDYEIEIESDSVIDTNEIYDKFGIEFGDKVTGKYARFINKLKEFNSI